MSALPAPVAYVLGGGASLGAVQVGMLQALDEAGVRPDLVVGTSVGALNGALLVEGLQDAPARMKEVWLQMQRRDIFPGNLLSVVWRLRQTGTHLVGTEGLEQIAARALHVARFEDLALPFAAVAVDLYSGEAIVLDRGPLLPALLASSAIPGIFAPVPIDDMLLVDGGVVANVPVGEAVARGAASVVVLDCTVPSPAAEVSDVGDIIARVTRIQQRIQLEEVLPSVGEQVPVVCLAAPDARRVSPLDFDQSAPLIRDSRRRARAQLKGLVITGPGLYGDPFSRYAGTPAAEGADQSATVAYR